MLPKMRLTRASLILLGLFAVTLTSCDPGVHLAWEGDIDKQINPNCIESALRSVAPDVMRTTYVDDGHGPRGFGRGITVTQFNYSDPTDSGGDYTFDIARLPNGKTHYWHQWGKLGTDVPADVRAKVEPLLDRANQVVARQCGLSFGTGGPKQGDG